VTRGFDAVAMGRYAAPGRNGTTCASLAGKKEVGGTTRAELMRLRLDAHSGAKASLWSRLRNTACPVGTARRRVCNGRGQPQQSQSAPREQRCRVACELHYPPFCGQPSVPIVSG